jgi:hypothetical protein
MHVTLKSLLCDATVTTILKQSVSCLVTVVAVVVAATVAEVVVVANAARNRVHQLYAKTQQSTVTAH